MLIGKLPSGPAIEILKASLPVFEDTHSYPLRPNTGCHSNGPLEEELEGAKPAAQRLPLYQIGI